MKARYFLIQQFSEKEVSKYEYYKLSNRLCAKEIRRYISEKEFNTKH